MKIYINSNYEIVSLDVEPEDCKNVFETDHTKEELFGSLCDACICGY